MYFSFRPTLLYAGLVLFVGTVAVPSQGPDRGDSAQAAPSLRIQNQTSPSVLSAEAQRTVSSLQARISLLPRPGGVSLDALVLALLGVGYGIWHLRNASNPTAQHGALFSSEPAPSVDYSLRLQQDRDSRRPRFEK